MGMRIRKLLILESCWFLKNEDLGIIKFESLNFFVILKFKDF